MLEYCNQNASFENEQCKKRQDQGDQQRKERHLSNQYGGYNLENSLKVKSKPAVHCSYNNKPQFDKSFYSDSSPITVTQTDGQSSNIQHTYQPRDSESKSESSRDPFSVTQQPKEDYRSNSQHQQVASKVKEVLQVMAYENSMVSSSNKSIHSYNVFKTGDDEVHDKFVSTESIKKLSGFPSSPDMFKD